MHLTIHCNVEKYKWNDKKEVFIFLKMQINEFATETLTKKICPHYDGKWKFRTNLMDWKNEYELRNAQNEFNLMEVSCEYSLAKDLASIITASSRIFGNNSLTELTIGNCTGANLALIRQIVTQNPSLKHLNCIDCKNLNMQQEDFFCNSDLEFSNRQKFYSDHVPNLLMELIPKTNSSLETLRANEVRYSF